MYRLRYMPRHSEPFRTPPQTPPTTPQTPPSTPPPPPNTPVSQTQPIPASQTRLAFAYNSTNIKLPLSMGSQRYFAPSHTPSSFQLQAPPQQIPQYLTTDHHFNATSTGSQDSVMTQAPGSFYPGTGNGDAVQDYNNMSAGNASIPFATPVLNNGGSSFQQDRSRGGLNPASANFQPGAYGAVGGSAVSAAALKALDNSNSSFGSTVSSEQDSINSSGNPYAQMDSGVSYNQYGGGVPLAPYSNQQPNRPQRGNDYGVNASSAYGPPRPFENPPNANYTGNQGYAPPKAPSFENLQAHNAYAGNQTQKMGRGNNSSDTDNQARYSQYQNAHNKKQAQYQAQYLPQKAQQAPAPFSSSSNMNRGKHNNQNNNDYSQRSAQASNLAITPVMNAGPIYQLTQVRNGGPIRPSLVVQCPIPQRTHVSFEAGPETPKHVAQTPTRTLRSRRGQDISSASKDVATADWIASPSNGGGGPGESQQFHGAPPRMGSLNIGDAGVKASDPRTPLTAVKNPFDLPKQVASFTNSGPVTIDSADGPTIALRQLTGNCTRRPTVQEALNPSNMPFAEYCRGTQAAVYGVIKISNIPYSVNRPEIIAFLGRNARITSDTEHEPVHIVMERVTSKTLDAYVEFNNFDEAVAAVNRFEVNRTGGRGGRLGQRHVEIELSSQDVLMKELFPKAKNVRWNGGVPIIAEKNPDDIYNSGFQGFISKEELVMLVKHVEAPQRSPFSRECPQRPFDCIISTLWKYPWYMVDHITIEDRQLLHEATLKLIYLLRAKLEDNEKNGAVTDTNISHMLFKRLWRAALKCPGFSPSQKDDIIVAACLDVQESIDHSVPPYAAEWKYMFTLGPKPKIPYDVVFYYAALIREGTEKQGSLMALTEKAARGIEDPKQKLFGELARFVDLPTEHEEFMHMTLGQVAVKEWAGIQQALVYALA